MVDALTKERNQLQAEISEYKLLCKGHVLAEKQWKAENEAYRQQQLRADSVYLAMEGKNDTLRKIISQYLQHCGNNYQICGLNTEAKQALKEKEN